MEFLKIGTRIINVDHISGAELDVGDEQNCVEICLVNSKSLFFYEEEADVLRKFLEYHNHTYDLKKIYLDKP